MKWLTVLFWDDGTYFGVQGNERPLRDGWTPPPYLLPGDAQVRQMIAVHLGCAEMPAGGCVCDDLFRALATHPESTPDAPKFAISDWARMPQIYHTPIFMTDFPAWMRANDPRRLPKAFRAWVTLTMPDVAKMYNLHRGVSLEDMLDVESRRGVKPEHSRVAELQEKIAARKAEARRAGMDRVRRAAFDHATAIIRAANAKKGEL